MHAVDPSADSRRVIEAIGRHARVTFDGAAVRIHREGEPDNVLAVERIAAVEFQSATGSRPGAIRFVPADNPAVEHRIEFLEWREGGFARLHDALLRII